jgi:ADP-ribosylglycohydrolase
VPTRTDRLAGGVLGHLVADALGVPYEFHPPHEIPATVTMTPPRGYRVAHRVPAGTWSDDGAQMLLLLDSLLSQGRVDPDDIGRRLRGWLYRGDYAVDRHTYDCGNATRTAIEALSRGVPAAEAGPRDERSNGNGSLMRVLPLALWHQGTDGDLVADAALQSRVTHGHVRSQVCCGVYSLWARRLLGGTDPAEALGDALDTYRSLVGAGVERRELDEQIEPLISDELSGQGYVVASLRTAATLLTRPGATYESVVRDAIALGYDTDTSACIVGGVAGVALGVGAIPSDWLAALRGRDLADPILARLLAA